MKPPLKSGLLIAAPASGSGKTVITLALLRALKKRGVDIASAKAGPDYIDPAFHALATGRHSVNLDPWAMQPKRCTGLAHRQAGTHLLVEGMMGLFDGAADGSGSAAELSRTLAVPVVLVVDAAKQSHSIAALVRGFRDHDPHVMFAGVILNKIGSERHGIMLREALLRIGVDVLGLVPRSKDLHLPARHLGLVQAGETENIEAFMDQAAEFVTQHCDLERLVLLFKPMQKPESASTLLKPLGQHIAIARDEAFSFVYPHLLDDWREQGAVLSFFSPLQDQAPHMQADAVYLPGGYPELHAERLANAGKFRQSLHAIRDNGALIYGECGGYMALGESLTDETGKSFPMTGLLPLQTSFEKRKLHLGYRRIKANGFALGDALNGHEFHYTSATREEGEPLFEATDAMGQSVGKCGLRSGKIMGSYLHVIDQVVS